jgi:hypothetical protein
VSKLATEMGAAWNFNGIQVAFGLKKNPVRGRVQVSPQEL